MFKELFLISVINIKITHSFQMSILNIRIVEVPGLERIQEHRALVMIELPPGKETIPNLGSRSFCARFGKKNVNFEKLLIFFLVFCKIHKLSGIKSIKLNKVQ